MSQWQAAPATCKHSSALEPVWLRTGVARNTSSGRSFAAGSRGGAPSVAAASPQSCTGHAWHACARRRQRKDCAPPTCPDLTDHALLAPGYAAGSAAAGSRDSSSTKATPASAPPRCAMCPICAPATVLPVAPLMMAVWAATSCPAQPSREHLEPGTSEECSRSDEYPRLMLALHCSSAGGTGRVHEACTAYMIAFPPLCLVPATVFHYCMGNADACSLGAHIVDSRHTVLTRGTR